MRNCFRNDLYYLLEDLDGNYEMGEDEVEALAHEKLSKTRLAPVQDLQRALRIEQGLEDPDFDGDSIIALGDWQTYRSQEYNEIFTDADPVIFDRWEVMLRRLQEKNRELSSGQASASSA